MDVDEAIDRTLSGVSYTMVAKAKATPPIERTCLALVGQLKSKMSGSNLNAQECAPTERERNGHYADRNRFAETTANISEQCCVQYILSVGSE